MIGWFPVFSPNTKVIANLIPGPLANESITLSPQREAVRVPQFFFNVYDGRDTIDLTGLDLPDQDSARQEAIRYTASLLAAEAHRLNPGEDWHMEVTDNAGLILFRLDFLVSTTAATNGFKQK